MPIRGRCSCNAVLELPDLAAGTQVPCPTCRRVIRVPVPRRLAVHPAVAVAVAVAHRPASPALVWSTAIGRTAETQPAAVRCGPECPSCHRVQAIGAVMCARCGYDLVARRRRPPGATVPSAEEQPGEGPGSLFSIITALIVHPTTAVPRFVMHLRDWSLVRRVALLYLACVVVAGSLQSMGGAGVTDAWLLPILRLLVDAASINIVASFLLGGRGNFGTVIVALAATHAVAGMVEGALSLLATLGLIGTLGVVPLTLASLVWRLVVGVLVVGAAYGFRTARSLVAVCLAAMIQFIGGLILGLAMVIPSLYGATP